MGNITSSLTNGKNATNGIDINGTESRTLNNDKWFFPEELREGLDTFGLSDATVEETLACAWEYSRCVIPEWKDWDRYIAFNRTIIVAIIAEFCGDLIPVDDNKPVVGYNLDELLYTLFGGTSMCEDMSREFRAFKLISTEKSSKRLDPELFSRYVNSLAESPQSWFRLRDCDALARYTMAHWRATTLATSSSRRASGRPFPSWPTRSTTPLPSTSTVLRVRPTTHSLMRVLRRAPRASGSTGRFSGPLMSRGRRTRQNAVFSTLCGSSAAPST